MADKEQGFGPLRGLAAFVRGVLSLLLVGTGLLFGSVGSRQKRPTISDRVAAVRATLADRSQGAALSNLDTAGGNDGAQVTETAQWVNWLNWNNWVNWNNWANWRNWLNY